MRLGDLDSLKETLDEQMNFEENCRDSIFEIIDNAPTVDTDEIYKKGYHAGFFATHGEPERPQGEWNYIQAGMAVCPFCGASPHKDYKNFCPNCGAKMNSKKENDNG